MDTIHGAERDPIYNSRVIDTYIKLLKKRYQYVNINDLLHYAEMKSYEVADQGHWFKQSQIDRFYERAVHITGNKNLAREAGQYAASPEVTGAMRQYVLGMINPAKAYEIVGTYAAKLTQSAIYKSKKIASNKVEICVTPLNGIQEKKFQCENRIGMFEAISMLFNNKPPRIEHPECIFSGGNVCRYVVSWEKTPVTFWKKIRNRLSILLVFLNLIAPLLIPANFFIPFFTASAFIVLLLFLISDYLYQNELKTSLSNLKDSSGKLLDQIKINYDNAYTTNEIGQTISKFTNIEDVLSKVTQIFKKRLNYDRGLILLANSEKTRLSIRAAYGYANKEVKFLKATQFNLDKIDSKGIFVVSFRQQEPFLINDVNQIEENLSSRSLVFAQKMGSKSFICCPIVSEGESIGIVAVDNLRSKKPLVKSDMSLLMGIASFLGISIRNAELIEAREKQFSSILHVLAASIDARDPLTAGHSEKVTEYSLGICDELGLPRDYREMIRVAALLHDYGKIGVEDSILKKPGRLTEEEHDIVKSHAVKTREILEQISFEGILKKVPKIAGAHHEKLD
ncbi:MAG: phosphohydrolase, partial [Desulfobacteraceae bacterium 4572_123]